MISGGNGGNNNQKGIAVPTMGAGRGSGNSNRNEEWTKKTIPMAAIKAIMEKEKGKARATGTMGTIGTKGNTGVPKGNQLRRVGGKGLTKVAKATKAARVAKAKAANISGEKARAKERIALNSSVHPAAEWHHSR